MPGLVLQNYLQSDVVDTTAALVRAANPDQNWTMDSQVPVYLYQSLKTILLGSGSLLADFKRRIVSGSGQHASVAAGFIEIVPVYCESVEYPEGMEINIPGGEFARVKFFFSLGRPVDPSMYQTLVDCELRIRTILDYANRNIKAFNGSNPSGQDLPLSSIAADNTIVSTAGYSLFRCKWLSLTNEPNTAELVSEYRVEYVRQFGNLILNVP